MKKFILLLNLLLSTGIYAQTTVKIETKLSDKSKVYKEHKKELIDQNKQYEDEKRKKGITTDKSNSSEMSESEFVDFSTGKPVKK